MQKHINFFTLSILILLSAGLYVSFFVSPLMYEHSQIYNTLEHKNELLLQIKGVEKNIIDLKQQLNPGYSNENQILQSIHINECSYKAHSEIVQLTQIYEIDLDAMEKEIVQVSDKNTNWENVLIVFKLIATWESYLRFKRALAVYPCPVWIINEKILTGISPNEINAELSLQLLKLKNAQDS